MSESETELEAMEAEAREMAAEPFMQALKETWALVGTHNGKGSR